MSSKTSKLKMNTIKYTYSKFDFRMSLFIVVSLYMTKPLNQNNNRPTRPSIISYYVTEAIQYPRLFLHSI